MNGDDLQCGEQHCPCQWRAQRFHKPHPEPLAWPWLYRRWVTRGCHWPRLAWCMQGGTLRTMHHDRTMEDLASWRPSICPCCCWVHCEKQVWCSDQLWQIAISEVLEHEKKRKKKKTSPELFCEHHVMRLSHGSGPHQLGIPQLSYLLPWFHHWRGWS